MELHEAAGTQQAAPNSSDGDAGVVVVWGNAVEDTLDAVESRSISVQYAFSTVSRISYTSPLWLQIFNFVRHQLG